MRKLIYIVGVLLFAAVACQKEGEHGSQRGECLTRLTVQVPEDVATKTVSQAELVDIVYYEVWSEDFQTLLMEGSNEVENRVAEMELALVTDQTYNFIFWAQNEAAQTYTWTNLKQVNVDYSKFTTNNKDCYDAFYAVETFTADGQAKTVRLYRPFAQLNFGASTMNAAFGEFQINSNTVTVSKYATAFDTVNDKAVDYVDASMTFTANAGGLVQTETDDDKDLLIGEAAYYWVAMNYLLVPDETNAIVTVSATFNTNIGPVTHNVPNVPLKMNYRTNIVGDLFTSTSSLKIVVDPDFNKTDENINVNN